MLTKRKIKKFCIHTIGIFLTDAEKDITVEKRSGEYILNLQNLRGPEHIVKDTWSRHTVGTEFERVYLNVEGFRRY